MKITVFVEGTIEMEAPAEMCEKVYTLAEKDSYPEWAKEACKMNVYLNGELEKMFPTFKEINAADAWREVDNNMREIYYEK